MEEVSRKVAKTQRTDAKTEGESGQKDWGQKNLPMQAVRYIRAVTFVASFFCPQFFCLSLFSFASLRLCVMVLSKADNQQARTPARRDFLRLLLFNKRQTTNGTNRHEFKISSFV